MLPWQDVANTHLALCGEYQAAKQLGVLCMIQRIAVRILLEHKGRVLVLRRSDGRESILGKYELPGGRVFAGEQPEDTLRRYLRDDLGIHEDIRLSLNDALTYTDADDRGIQYAIFLYRAIIDDIKRSFTLSEHYDKYTWYNPDNFHIDKLTELTRLILRIKQVAPVPELVEDSTSLAMPTVYTDGGSRGNPGPSAGGYILLDKKGDLIRQGGQFIGVTTSDQAEYRAVRLGLAAALREGWNCIELRSDSSLVVNQLNGTHKVKEPELEEIFKSVKNLVRYFEKVKFVHIPREQNSLADGIVNKILDKIEQSKV